MGHIVKGYRRGTYTSLSNVIKECLYLNSYKIDDINFYGYNSGKLDLTSIDKSFVNKIAIFNEFKDIIYICGYIVNDLKRWGNLDTGLYRSASYIDISISICNLSVKKKDWPMYLKYKRKQSSDIYIEMGRWIISKEILLNSCKITVILNDLSFVLTKVIYTRWYNISKLMPYREINYQTYTRNTRVNVTSESISAIIRLSSGISVVDIISICIKATREYDRNHIRVIKIWDRLITLHGTKGLVGKRRKGTWYGGKGYYGYRINVKGTLEGSRRTTSYSIKLGMMPYSTKRVYTKYSLNTAVTSIGTLGIYIEYCYGI